MGGKIGVCQLWLLQDGGHTPNNDLWWLAGYSGETDKGEASLHFTIFVFDSKYDTFLLLIVPLAQDFIHLPLNALSYCGLQIRGHTQHSTYNIVS